MKRILMTAAVVVAFSVIGCTNMTQKQQGTASGAAIGAVAGAGIVALTGGSAWTGAAVGLVAGGVAGHIFAGAVLLESIFAWPGLGQYALQAIERSDFAALQGFVIYASLLYVLAFLLVDLLYMFIDPRIRA